MCKHVPPIRLDHEMELSLVVTVGSYPWKHMGHRAHAQGTAHWWVTISWEVSASRWLLKINCRPLWMICLVLYRVWINHDAIITHIFHSCFLCSTDAGGVTSVWKPPHGPTACHPSTQQVFVKHLLCANLVPGLMTHRTDVRSALRELAKQQDKLPSTLQNIFWIFPATVGGAIISSTLYVFGSAGAKAHSLNQWTPNTSAHAFFFTCVCA